MPPRVLFDTDVLIDASRGVPDAVAALSGAARKYDVAISAITRMELIVGCRDGRELRDTESFVKRFRVLPIDERPRTGLSICLCNTGSATGC